MKIKNIKLKNKIKEVEFSPKELYMFKKKIKTKNSQCKVGANDIHSIIHSSAKRVFLDSLMVFVGLLFFQIPFIVSEIFLSSWISYLYRRLLCFLYIRWFICQAG